MELIKSIKVIESIKVKVCFLICGLPRSIDLIMLNVESLFDETKYDIHYYICSAKSAVDGTSLESVKTNSRVQNIVSVPDELDSSFRNSINYFKKVSFITRMVPPIYDIYLVIRSDFIFENIDFFQYNNFEPRTIYFSLENKSCYTKNVENRVNEQIIISKDYTIIQKFGQLYDFSLENNNYADIIMYHFLKYLKSTHPEIVYREIVIQYKIILSKCNIIAISGDSGSGKTTLMKYLQCIYGNNAIQFETDRYHKWERGNENYKKYTHLNPFSNHLELMSSDVYNLKIGNDIFQVDYDHDTGKFTAKQKIEAKDNIILCGLHTLYSNKINQILDLKIFMDTQRELITSWKIKRDTSKRGYSEEQIKKQIQDREKDYYEFIDHQKQNADIIVRFYTKYILRKEEPDGCQLIIQSPDIFNKISPILAKYNYSTTILESKAIIELSNNYRQLVKKGNELDSIIKRIHGNIQKEGEVEGEETRMHNYYCEILAIINSILT